VKLSDLRAALADSVRGIGEPALIAYPYPPDTPTTPCAVVEPELVDWRARPGATFARGSEVWTLSVFVLVAPADAANAARQLDDLFDRDASDIKNALEGALTNADPELSGSVEVTSADRWGEYPVAGVTYAGLRFVVEVLG
jgi:hypothetical protein